MAINGAKHALGVNGQLYSCCTLVLFRETFCEENCEKRNIYIF